MNDHQARRHERVVIRDGRGDTSLQMANLGFNEFNARRLHSVPTAP
jgi:hypothetical protein